MNPLDNLELPFFFKELESIMPLHSDISLRLKNVNHLPKNIKDFSEHRNTKALDNNLAIIEEISHRDSKHWIPKWFKEYQNKYYGDTDVLNHDNFYIIDSNSRLCIPPISGGSFFNQNMLSYSNASVNRVNIGATIETVASDTSADNWATDVGIFKILTGSTVVGTKYNTIYPKIGGTSAGTMHLGAYSDSSGPVNLLRDSGSIVAPAINTYNANTVTEFEITTTTTWLAILGGVSDIHVRHLACTSGESKYTSAVGDVAFPNPASGMTNYTFIGRMKIAYI